VVNDLPAICVGRLYEGAAAAAAEQLLQRSAHALKKEGDGEVGGGRERRGGGGGVRRCRPVWRSRARTAGEKRGEEDVADTEGGAALPWGWSGRERL
jgi:hypothetical protein